MLQGRHRSQIHSSPGTPTSWSACPLQANGCRWEWPAITVRARCSSTGTTSLHRNWRDASMKSPVRSTVSSSDASTSATPTSNASRPAPISDTFLARHADVLERVPAAGERLSLGMAGNHCQGTLFLDGHHLITPELEGRIDEIARAFDGFFIGRFDIRYADVECFKAGTDLRYIPRPARRRPGARARCRRTAVVGNGRQSLSGHAVPRRAPPHYTGTGGTHR